MKSEFNPNAVTFFPTQKNANSVFKCSSRNIGIHHEQSICAEFNNDNSEIAPPPNSNSTPCIISPITFTVNSEPDSYSSLKDLRCRNPNRVIFAHLNINSIRSKFDVLRDMVTKNIDILLISETKIDNSFPDAQFCMAGFSIPYRRDRTKFGGGILLYVREDIPSKLITPLVPIDIECVFIEINFHKKKWLVVGSYNPLKSTIADHLEKLGKHLDTILPLYDNVIIMGDFNSEPHEYDMSEFCAIYGLKNLVKEPTCFKSTENPSCVDLILTNRHRSFQSTITLETGISDFHKMPVTILKTYFKKGPPKIISYRDYSRYSPHIFRSDLEKALPLEIILSMPHEIFMDIFMNVLERHAPIKFKYLRINHNPFITKEIRKEIMKRSRLRNRVNKLNSRTNISAYKRQRNICTRLIRKAKRDYFSNLSPSNIVDSRRFWSSVKPLFSDKGITGKNIIIVENNTIIDNDSKVTEIFSNLFSNTVKTLGIEKPHDVIVNIAEYDSEFDPVMRAINKYNTHPSIKLITKSRYNCQDTFSFSDATLEDVFNELLKLTNSTSCPIVSIPTKIIKENIDIITHKIHIDFNHSIVSGIFPSNLKLADVTPAHKKGDRTDKSNYRPISILTNISKVFERLMFYQMYTYIENILSNYQCGFRKNYSSQHCLLIMLERWKKCLDKKGTAGVLLTDLSKAFDCLNHDLLIAKLHAYGFDYKSLKFIQDYLSYRYQRVKINSSYSSWKLILQGVPQGSILGPVLFNIYLTDLFLFAAEANIANYADDNSPYACKPNTDLVITQLQEDSNKLLRWFSHNYLKANPDKFHLILNDTDENISIMLGQYEIHNSNNQKLLGVTIDNKLTFNEHVTSLCKKATKKLHALTRVSRFMNTEKKRVIMKSFITSHFNYCPLIWMLHSRTLNTRINRIHERALRIVYCDNISTFTELLEKDNSVTVHERNIQTLAIEVFKVLNGLSPKIMNEIFPIKDNIGHCSRFPFTTSNIRTVYYGTETISFLGPKIWSILPNEIKESESLIEFKNKIRKWKPKECPCRLCKTYLSGVGFITVAV